MAHLEYPELATLWWEEDVDSLRCCTCGAQITPDALIRTFRLQAPYVDNSDKDQQRPSQTLQLPRDMVMLLYDRHFKCLKRIPYVAVSHMWETEVSKAQVAGRCATPSNEAQTIAYQFAVNVYAGLVRDRAGERPEMWHDYISVPQWNPKDKILMAIPQIFSEADYTLVHLHDVDRASVRKLRSDSGEERISGVTSICNGLWFRRIWTAMEFVQSPRVKVMLSDYKLADGVDDLFLEEMDAIWNREVTRWGNVQRVERQVAGAGENLVPWMLGPLRDIRMLRTTVFAHAFTLLSTRRCTQRHDFFYALLGIVRTNLKGAELDRDDTRACLQIARACLEAGDYSPLLMLSRNYNTHHFFAYHDVSPWGLGRQVSPPAFADGLRIQKDGRLRLKAENIGAINFARAMIPLHFEPDRQSFLSNVIDTVLDYTGPHDMDAIIHTVGTRVFGQDAQEILDRLAVDNARLKRMKDVMLQRYNSPFRMFDHNKWVDREETMNFIGNALGLFNNCLTRGAKLPGETPLAFVRARGATIHGGNATGVLFSAVCVVCRKSFLFRAGLMGKHPSETLGATAYRIPGLDYEYTLKDGVGIIVKDGEVLGRMVWACPACDCRPVEDIDLRLPELLMPVPATRKFGGK